MKGRNFTLKLKGKAKGEKGKSRRECILLPRNRGPNLRLFCLENKRRKKEEKKKKKKKKKILRSSGKKKKESRRLSFQFHSPRGAGEKKKAPVDEGCGGKKEDHRESRRRKTAHVALTQLLKLH